MFMCIKKNSGAFNMEDSPKKIMFNVPNNCRCCNKTVLVKNHPVDIFGEKSIQEPELSNVLQFLTGKEIKYDDGLPKKLYQPCFRKVKNIIEFRALSLATLSAQELLIGETRMKRVRGSQTGWRITFFESTGEKDWGRSTSPPSV